MSRDYGAHMRRDPSEPCTICDGLGCAVCRGTGRRPYKEYKLPGVTVGGYHGPPPPRPERIPDDICRNCYSTDFGPQLANTFCFGAEWIILGFDDWGGTKNPPDWRREAGLLSMEERRIPPAEPPRFMWADGMWGMQIRLYKDANT